MSEEHLIASTVTTVPRYEIPELRHESAIHVLYIESRSKILATNVDIPRAPEGRPQDTTGARRMPWHRGATKDAASRDSPGVGAHVRRSRGLRMGEPMHRGMHTSRVNI